MSSKLFRLSMIALLFSGCGDDDGGDKNSADASISSADADSITVDYQARIRLINQKWLHEDPSFFVSGGTAIAHYFPKEALPSDTRMSFNNTDGETCTYEESPSLWPLTDGVNSWPTTLIDAGDLQFDITGGPNQIVFENDQEGNYLRKSPDKIIVDGTSFDSFFDASNLPPGAALTMKALGGADIGSFSIAGTLPKEYTVSAPNMATAADKIDVAKEFTFTWSPAEPGANMEVILKDGFSFVRCSFADDGSGTVPAQAMKKLIGGGFNTLTVHTIKQVGQKKILRDSNGKGVEVDWISEHIKIVKFGTEDSSQ